MMLRAYAPMLMATLLSPGAWAQEYLAAYLALKPYFVGDTNAVTVPHTTCDLLVGPVADSVSYYGTWRADKSALCVELIKEAAKRERSVLFNLKFVGDHVDVGMITHLAQTIVDAHNDAAIDTAITKSFIHVGFPPLPIPRLETQDQEVRARVHINADGSLLLDESAANLIGLGNALEERRVTVVYIGADVGATMGALGAVVRELTAHGIKAILATGR